MAQASKSVDLSTCKRAADVTHSDRDKHTQAAAIRPRWISHSNTFWYLRSNALGDSTFIYVDPGRGLREPAFDHAEVARALSQQGVQASAENLPFTSIDVKDNRTAVRFHARGRSWEWGKGGILSAFEGEINTAEKLRPLVEERPSAKSSHETKIVFFNKTKARVSLRWVDWFGKEKHYHQLDAGHTVTQRTYKGHIWRVIGAEDGEAIATFAAESEEKTAVIEDGLTAAKVLGEIPDSASAHESTEADEMGIFFKENNVWLRNADGEETQLSTTGTADSPFSDITWYSPDSKFVVIFQSTPEQEHTVHTVESSPKDQLQPRLKQFQYLKPGDKVAIDRPRMFDLVSKKEVPTDNLLFQNPFRIYPLRDNAWNVEGTEFRFIFNQRGHQVLRVIAMNTEGKVRSVIEETSNTFIDYSQKLYYREIRSSNASEMIWASERDG